MSADPVAAFITARLYEWEQVHVQPALVAALRAIHTAHGADGTFRPLCVTCGDGDAGTAESWPCPTVRHIAATWSDHPDYQNRWKP